MDNGAGYSAPLNSATKRAKNNDPSTGTYSTALQALARHALAAIAVCARLPLVPVDRQPDEDDRDDPENNVFATAFFLGHARQYNTSEIAVQVSIEFPRSRTWFRLLYLRPIALEFNNLAISLPALGSTT
jgi:hypothetical protein